jgi:hypothetical protein
MSAYLHRLGKWPTAFSSPKFPCVAKWALRDAFELPAATPHKLRSTLEQLSKTTLDALGSAGDKQSRIIAESLNMSAANRYILHSGSSDVPSLWAKRIVAIRPILSWRTERRSAAVGEACESPTPMPIYKLVSFGGLLRVTRFRLTFKHCPAW